MQEKLLTAAEFEQLPELSAGFRHELVRGHVVPRPLRTWQCAEITGNVAYAIKRYLNVAQVGAASIGAGFVVERTPDTVRAPDVAFITNSRKSPGRLNRFLHGSPDLCVEVMTEDDSDDAFRDRAVQYLNTGAAAVWLVRSTERTVSVHRAAGAVIVLDDEMCLDGGDVLPGFTCPVADFFK